MDIRIRSAHDTEEVASFIAMLNSHRTNHIGFCGEDEKEIRYVLEHDFSDTGFESSFFVADEEGRIAGVIGFDIDSDEGSAEVWGPFVREDLPFKEVASRLWNEALASIQGMGSFLFFMNEENTDVSSFAEQLGGVHAGRHLILQAKEGAVLSNEHPAVPAEPGYEEAFRMLHADAFPGTYLSAEEILAMRDAAHCLLIIPDGDTGVKGYVYTEADPIHGNGSIEFLAVVKDYRRQGIATRLLEAGLAALFHHELIRDVRLTVEEDNGAALGLYEAAGFERLHRMNAYRLRLD